MLNKQPLPFGAHYSASSFCSMVYHDSLDFFIPLSSSNVLDTRFGDRFDYINQMVIGVNSPAGYVLGTIAPHISGMIYSLTGADSSRFSISDTGQITLIDNSALSAGNLTFNVVNNIYGTIPVTVPVVSGTGSYLFYDSVNGSDSNSGTQPHSAKLTLPTGTPTVGTIYLRRGSTFTKNGSLTPNDGKTYRGYGDPSSERPIIQESSQSVVNLLAVSLNNLEVYDIWFKGGRRAINVETATNYKLKRCKATGYGSSTDGYSQGFYTKGVTYPIIKHNETDDGYGDGIYVVASKQGEISYNRLLTPKDGVGDCMQITDENNFSKRCTDLHIHHNIGDYNKSSASVKGSMVMQGCTSCTYEHNVAWGHNFGHSIAGTRSVIRHNISFYAFMNPRSYYEFNMIGAAEHIDKLKVYDNTFMFTQRGLNLSGYSGNGFSEWDRADIDAQWNMIMFSKEAFKATERWTGSIKNNIFCSNVDNTFQETTRGNTDATISVEVVSFTNNGSGIGTFNSNPVVYSHRMSKGDTVAITGANAELNKTWVIADVWNNTSFRVSGVTTETTVTGLSGTGTKILDFSTQNDGATENIFQTEVGTVLKNRPTITGNCQDGQTVTITSVIPVGHTVTYQWRLNHSTISGATNSSYTVPALTSATANNQYGSQYNNLNKPQLSCIMKITNPKGMASFITPVWTDGDVYKTVVA